MLWFTTFLSFWLFGFDAVSKIPEEASVSVMGTYEKDDLLFEYGSVYYGDGNYDGYIGVKSIIQNIYIDQMIFDDQDVELFQYLADMGNDRYFLVCKQYETTTGMELPSFQKTIILAYDYNNHTLNIVYTSPVNFKAFHNHNNRLILVPNGGDILYMDQNGKIEENYQPLQNYTGNYDALYQGEAYVDQILVDSLDLFEPGYYAITIKDNTYEFSYTITIHPQVTFHGETFGEYFMGEVSIESKGILFLNNQLYESQTILSTPGNYHLTIYGANGYEKQYPFTILPSIRYFDGTTSVDLVEDIVLYRPTKIYTNAISMTLDGEVYQSETIETTGSHTLMVYGINGFCAEIRFSIYPTVTGIEDQKEYHFVDFQVFGEAYLNDELVQGDVHLEEPGTYILRLVLEDETYQTITFMILAEEAEEQDAGESFDYRNLILIGILLLGGYYILRKK